MRQPHDPSFLFLDSVDLSAVAFLTGVASAKTVAKEEGVPLAVANRVFGKDALKPISACPPKPRRRRKELNELLVA